VETGVRKWCARFYNGDILGGFPGIREIFKPKNKFKDFSEMDESFAKEISKHSI
jgi:hypothetical protein